jgi:hypothetical protein
MTTEVNAEKVIVELPLPDSLPANAKGVETLRVIEDMNDLDPHGQPKIHITTIDDPDDAWGVDLANIARAVVRDYSMRFALNRGDEHDLFAVLTVGFDTQVKKIQQADSDALQAEYAALCAEYHPKIMAWLAQHAAVVEGWVDEERGERLSHAQIAAFIFDDARDNWGYGDGWTEDCDSLNALLGEAFANVERALKAKPARVITGSRDWIDAIHDG